MGLGWAFSAASHICLSFECLLWAGRRGLKRGPGFQRQSRGSLARTHAHTHVRTLGLGRSELYCAPPPPPIPGGPQAPGPLPEHPFPTPSPDGPLPQLVSVLPTPSCRGQGRAGVLGSFCHWPEPGFCGRGGRLAAWGALPSWHWGWDAWELRHEGSASASGGGHGVAPRRRACSSLRSK